MALNLLDLPMGQDNEEDDEGEFCPCAFSDDEEEEKNWIRNNHCQAVKKTTNGTKKSN